MAVAMVKNASNQKTDATLQKQLFEIYRVSHTYLTKVILLKMTLKCIFHMKARHFYNHKDPPFDMNHQLMSADQRFVVSFDLKERN